MMKTVSNAGMSQAQLERGYIHCPKTHYFAQLGHLNKGSAINGLVI